MAPLRIAVIGSGISGLTAAHRLASRHEITLYEARSTLGGHTNTVDIEFDGERHSIDTGFIVYNERNYPLFTALLAELGVRSRPTTMSFSVSSDGGGFEYNGSSLNGLFADRVNLLRPRFHRLLLEILRFHRELRDARASGAVDDAQTVADFLRARRYGRDLAEHYLYPMGSAIWSCATGAFEEFPIGFVAQFFDNHGLLQLRDRPIWRVIEGGSRTYIDAMMRRFNGRIRLATPVDCIRRFDDRVEVVARDGPTERYDHVILACHADQSLRLLERATPIERATLSAFSFERSVAVLHTDTTVLPRRRRAWASWNFRVRADRDSPPVVTYCMNILQHIQSRNVFSVTLNAEARIEPRAIIGRFHYEHPLVTRASRTAALSHSSLLVANRTSYCGAYWGNGFHEDGVRSAVAVCEAIERHAGVRPAPSPVGAA